MQTKKPVSTCDTPQMSHVPQTSCRWNPKGCTFWGQDGYFSRMKREVSSVSLVRINTPVSKENSSSRVKARFSYQGDFLWERRREGETIKRVLMGFQ